LLAVSYCSALLQLESELREPLEMAVEDDGKEKKLG
jgi:hypothetical protein